MGNTVSFDVGAAIPYMVEQVLLLLRQDAASLEWKRRLERSIRLATLTARSVQCIGMAQPVPLGLLYQPLTILVPHGKEFEAVTYHGLLHRVSAAAIFAGPGWGKTTLLHWMYLQLVASDDYLPLLLPLRWQNAVSDLSDLVEALEAGRRIPNKGQKHIVLLVDGYDEIPEHERRSVSAALNAFRSLEIGSFYLTCREYYDLIDLAIPHCKLAPFSSWDSLRFIAAFGKVYGTQIDANQVYRDLTTHGLSDFASHPLLLSLVCILQLGPDKHIPRRAMGLIRRAIDTLTFRWDHFRGIRREPSLRLDGEERVRCLMRVAFKLQKIQAPWAEVELAVREHLNLIQASDINPRILVEELAKWYGMLVATADDNWQFSHRAIHDFLAARHWVETGDFARQHVIEWNSRAAYATCLLPDATSRIIGMWLSGGSIAYAAFCECLYNNALFDAKTVAAAIAKSGGGGVNNSFLEEQSNGDVVARTNLDFYSLCSDELLKHLVGAARESETNGSEAVAAFALGTLQRRGKAVEPSLVSSRFRQLLEREKEQLIVLNGRSGGVYSGVYEYRLRDVVRL